MGTEVNDNVNYDPVNIDFESSEPIKICPLRASDDDEICESCQ